MKEYFEISFLSEKSEAEKLPNIQFENILGVQFNKQQITGNSFMFPFLRNKKILLEYFNSEQNNYTEHVISITDCKFSKADFDKQKQNFYDFIKFFAEKTKAVFVVASYELNSFLLENITDINDFSDDVLLQFPFLFTWKNNNILMNYNQNAQNIY